MPPGDMTTVIYAPEPIRAEVNRLRAAAPPSGVPVMEAHVTTKGTFTGVPPEEALAIMRRICAKVPPVPLRCRGLQVWLGRNEDASLTVPVWRHPELLRLHDALQSALGDPDAAPYWPDQPHWFSPHLTLVQQMPRARLEEALTALLPAPEWSFVGTEVVLMQQDAERRWFELGRVPLMGEADGFAALTTGVIGAL